MYKKLSAYGKEINSILRVGDHAFIPFDPANTDYANFKRDILSGTATLHDADGVEMTPAAAHEFVQGLP